VKFKLSDEDENSWNNSDAEEDVEEMGDQLQAIYAAKSKRPPPKPTGLRHLSLIEKKVFEA